LCRESEAAPFIESLRQRLASLRGKTLAAIDKRLASSDNDVQNLVQGMCAFSLTTSSSPTDVLRHFHSVRLKAIVWHLEQKIDTRRHVIDAVKLLLTTLRDSQLIFPKPLSEALAKLKEQPLMRQPDLLSVSELSLDLYERWVADELRSYTPWPRHDELHKPEAEKLLKIWAKQALKTFMAGLEAALAEQTDFKHVMNIRKDLLEAWPWSDTRLPGLHSADVVDGFRNILNTRLVEIIQQNVGQLQHLPVAISRTLERDEVGSDRTTPLWDKSMTSIEFGDGGNSFKRAVLARYHGGESIVANIMPIFDTWTKDMMSIRSMLKEMRDSRWDDDITEDADDLDSRQVLLSEDDPRSLEETLESSLDAVSKELHSALLQIVRSVEKSDDRKPAQAIFMLRLLREMSQRSASQETRLAAVCTTSTGSTEILSPLHSVLVVSVTSPALTRYRTSLSKMLRGSALEARTLWEGNPQLPIQPSATAFKFLHKLTKDLSACGTDLWASGATTAAKVVVVEQLSSILAEAVSKIRAQIINGAEIKGENQSGWDGGSQSEMDAGSQDKKELLTQLLLDVLYLQKAFELDTASSEILAPIVEDIISGTELNEVEINRIRKSGLEYWRRTYLLFALWVPGS
jgi:hypothetical protein